MGLELPEGLFVKPVSGDDDVVAFTFPFELTVEGKAIDGPIAAEVSDESDDLIIEGWAADFSGVDREGENFTDGAFKGAINDFLKGSAALCFHHKHDQVLGKVLDLEEVEGKGLKMRARVDGAIKNHPTLGTVYKQVKNGTLRNLSVGGFFKRVMTPAGYRIGGCDFTEISITGVPVHTKPSFAVVGQKALEVLDHDEEPHGGDFVEVIEPLSDALRRLEASFAKFEGKAVKGEPGDLEFLATLLKLEQATNSILTENEAHEKYGLGSSEPKGDERVDALAKRVKNYLDGVAREAHSLAAELGPLPSTGY